MATGDTAADLARQVRDAVRDHYTQRPDAPLYLAQLGQLVPVPREVSLRRLIDDECVGEVVIIEDPAVRTRTAAALASNADQIRATLERTSPATTDVLRHVPKPLLYAFSKGNEEGRLFYASAPRPRYVIANEAPGPDFHEIEPEFRKRLPHFFQHIGDLPAEARSDLATRIEAWAKAKGLNIDQLTPSRRKREPRSESIVTSTGPRNSALDRLLAAQPPGVVEQMVIPGDIAQLLLQRR